METTDLPTIEKLYQKYKIFNEDYFNNQLPKGVTIEWSKKMTSAAGLCYPRKMIIRLSVWYHLKYPQEVESTLLHEMIHLKVHNHGAEFKKYLKDLQEKGALVSRYAKEKAKDPRWLYLCPKCGASFNSYRRQLNKYICRKCKMNFNEVALLYID